MRPGRTGHPQIGFVLFAVGERCPAENGFINVKIALIKRRVLLHNLLQRVKYVYLFKLIHGLSPFQILFDAALLLLVLFRGACGLRLTGFQLSADRGLFVLAAALRRFPVLGLDRSGKSG